MNPQPKDKAFRSEKYKAFVRSYGCLVCGKAAEAHHEPLFNSGMGKKDSDSVCLPLCPECHRLRHSMGCVTFWDRHNIAPEMWIIRLLTEYLQSGR